MSRSVSFTFQTIGETGAGLGQGASGHSLIADRPAGIAGGSGLGFNGADLLAASLGGCFWNDLHHAAAATPGFHIDRLEARVDLAGDPPRVVRARIGVRLSGADAQTLARLFEAACEGSTIANSLRPALQISFARL